MHLSQGHDMFIIYTKDMVQSDLRVRLTWIKKHRKARRIFQRILLTWYKHISKGIASYITSYSQTMILEKYISIKTISTMLFYRSGILM